MAIKQEDRILKLSDGQEVYIKEISVKDQREARKVYNTAFRDALESGCYMRSQLNEILTEKGLWDDKKQSRLSTIEAEIRQYEDKLRRGGISLNDAKEIAVKIRGLRFERRIILTDRISYDSHSVEGQADQAQFDWLLANSVVYNKNRKQKYFKNVDDYLERGNEEDSVAIASRFSRIYYGTFESEKDLVENNFLVKYKFADEQLRFVDKEGKLVDASGKFIDEQGRRIEYREDGSTYFVDNDGNEVDEQGNPIVEFTPFTDPETGEPVILDEDLPADEDKKKK